MNLTAREIVVLKINNLPRTYRNIDKLAIRQSWAFVERPSAGRNGKTRLYVVDKLPEPYRSLIQAALIEKQVRESGVAVGCSDSATLRGGEIATSATHSRNDSSRTVSAVGKNAHPTAVRSALGVKALPFSKLLTDKGSGCLKKDSAALLRSEIATSATHSRNDSSRAVSAVGWEAHPTADGGCAVGFGGVMPHPTSKQAVAGRRELSVAMYQSAFLNLTQSQKEVADARLVLVRAVLRLADALGVSAKTACVQVVEVVNGGGVAVGCVAHPATDSATLLRSEIATLPAVARNDRNGKGIATPCEARLAMTEVNWDRVFQAALIANARKNNNRTLSVPSLMRWVKAVRESASSFEFMVKLSPKPPHSEIPLDGLPWIGAFLSFYRKPNKPTTVMAYDEFRAWWLEEKQGDTANLPSFSTVQRVVKRLPEIVKQVGRKTGSELRQVMPYIERDWSGLKPNDVWIGDGHSFKARVAHPVHGNPFKPEVTMIIDGHTRLIVGWAVSLAENTLAVADALRFGVQTWGCPLIYYSDNGAGQTAKVLDDAEIGILERLGVSHHTGVAGNPQGRGIIERLWQSTLIPLAKTYATYLGADADQRVMQKHYRELNSAAKAWNAGRELTVKQAKRHAEMPSFKQFLADVAACVAKYNEEHRHSGLPRNGHGQHWTPFGYYKRRCEELRFLPDYVPDLELNSLFMPSVQRTVNRCLIRWLDNSYFSLALAPYHGEKVVIRYDIHDGKQVQVWSKDGKFICIAQFEGNKVAAFAESAIENAQRKRTERRIKHLEEQKALAEAELRPAIETVDFSMMIGNGEEEAVLLEKQEYRFL
ncbi:MAG: transposase [Neisseriaceae bacterium]|nr:transposase [Neisseriaceae bacterium]